MSEPLYQIRDVEQWYNGRCVLTIENLTIHPGEIIGVVGPSGAGKSTLLRLLNFLEPPTQGEIAFRGRPFRAGQEMPLPLRRRVTTVFQRPFLLNRSVAANVGYGLSLRGNRNEKARVADALAQVGLDGSTDQQARTLSGGEAQRVALARAIVIDPEVLLLDEPTANLDPYNVNLIETIIRRRNETAGTTLVLVTHNVFQARRLAQRVIFLLNGHVVEISDAETFFNDPKDRRTTAFVKGEMVY
jgi:tungstate transport system ATP-binding protein